MSDMNPDNLIPILCSIRRRLRLLLLIDGLGWLVIGLVSGSLLFGLLDWWVHFPWFVRAGGLLLGICWGGYWGVRRVVRPLIVSVGLEELALHLGRHNAESQDRLPSAVTYLCKGGVGAPELWRQVINKTLKTLDHEPLAKGLNHKRAIRSGLCGVAVLGLLAGLHIASPDLVGIGWRRLVMPLGDVAWPKSVKIVPLTGDTLVAFGDSLTVEMRLQRGDDPDLRAYVEWMQPGSRLEPVMMRRGGDGVYRHVFEIVQRPMQYAFSVGDDDTLDHPFSVQVVRRPAVSSLRFVFSPPAYANNLPDVIVPLDETVAETVIGSHARLEVIPNKLLLPADERESVNYMQFEDGRRIKLIPSASAGKLLVGEFLVEKGGKFEIHLEDNLGFQSRSEHRYLLAAREDRLPKVEIIEPAVDLRITLRGRLDVRVRAEDDFGIDSLHLVASSNDAEEMRVGERKEGGDEQDVGPRTKLTWEYPWRIGATFKALKPGDLVEYVAQTQDNYVSASQDHAPVRSSVRHLRIVSMSELAEILQQTVFNTRGALRQLLSDLQAVESESLRVDQGPASGQPISAQQKGTVEQLVRELRRAVTSAGRISDHFMETARRAEMNRASRLDVALQSERLGRTLFGLIDDAMQTAAIAMTNAAEAAKPSEQHESLQTSLQQQNTMIAALKEMLVGLQRWNEFEDVVRLTRELLDRQENLLRDVVQFGRQNGGREVDQLETAQRSTLQRTQMRQVQLRSDTVTLIRNIRQLSDVLRKAQPVAADALGRALDASNQWMVAEQMEDAAAEIKQNRMHHAHELIDRVAKGLRAMLMALESKPDRELAELSRELADVVARISKLILTQQRLGDQTKAIGVPDQSIHLIEKLADRQTSLSKTAETLASSIRAGEYEGPAAKTIILEAVSQMLAAAGALNQMEISTADQAQERALGDLQDALALLQTLQERTERLIAERSLASILEALVALHDSEKALHLETDAIHQRAGSRGQISRVDGLKLNKMAEQQKELIETVKDVQEKMARSVVYSHVCNQVREEMSQAADRLRAHDIGKAITHQKHILRRLLSLIGGIEDQPRKTNGRYVASQGGGGGGGGPTRSNPVPTLSELKVLRLMQVDLNDQTRSIDHALPDPLLRSEEQLQQIEKVGLTQRELHSLSIQMIQKANEKEGQ